MSDGTTAYTYDHANRLTTATQGGDSYSFAYNGQGDRLQQTVNTVTTNYSLDLNTGLTQVLSDGPTTYLYGNSRISEYAAVDWTYYLSDALGSVRQLVDSSPLVLLAQSFDPFGNTIITYGEVSSNYGYTGEWTDGTGLQHLRARYLDTGIGRFISRDTYEGDFNDPLSLNRWNYVEGNPVNYADPTGMCYTNGNPFSKGFWERFWEKPILGPCPSNSTIPIPSPTSTSEPTETCTPTIIPTSTPVPSPSSTSTPCPQSYLQNEVAVASRIYFEGASSIPNREEAEDLFKHQCWALKSLLPMHPSNTWDEMTSDCNFLSACNQTTGAPPWAIQATRDILGFPGCGLQNPFEGKIVHWISPQNFPRVNQNGSYMTFRSSAVPGCNGVDCQLNDMRRLEWLRSMSIYEKERFIDLQINGKEECYWMGVYFIEDANWSPIYGATPLPYTSEGIKCP